MLRWGAATHKNNLVHLLCMCACGTEMSPRVSLREALVEAGGGGVLLSCHRAAARATVKNWRQVFPGLSNKKQKHKRRASKDSDKLIAEFKKMAEGTLKLPEMKMARMERPAAAMMVTEE